MPVQPAPPKLAVIKFRHFGRGCYGEFGVAVGQMTPTRVRPSIGESHRAVHTVDELLIAARASLPPRPYPAEVLIAQVTGALLIDIRGDDQRRDFGVIPGALLVPRNSLEWRCDPTCGWRHPAITGHDHHLIVGCQQGYQSSLAAVTLQWLGHIDVTNMDRLQTQAMDLDMRVMPPSITSALCSRSRSRAGWRTDRPITLSAPHHGQVAGRSGPSPGSLGCGGVPVIALSATS